MENTVKIYFDSEYFNIQSTLECGQVFRFKNFNNGYLVFSLDKCAYLYCENNKTVIECNEDDKEYFIKYFDLGRDYSLIFERAEKFGIDTLKISARLGKGIRILNQDPFETLISFTISQNNNIPRIKNSIEKIMSLPEDMVLYHKSEYYPPNQDPEYK